MSPSSSEMSPGPNAPPMECAADCIRTLFAVFVLSLAHPPVRRPFRGGGAREVGPSSSRKRSSPEGLACLG